MGKAIAADPAIGIWKLNLVKSGFALAPAPKSSSSLDGLAPQIAAVEVQQP